MPTSLPIKFPKVEDMCSIFTSHWFTTFVEEVLPQLDAHSEFLTIQDGRLIAVPRSAVATKFDGDELDLVNFMNKFGSFLGDATCSLSTGIGITETGEPLVSMFTDPLNAEVGLAMYRLQQHQNHAKHFFPTPELTDALNNTDLKWVDLKAFADLPGVTTIRLRGFKCKVNGEVHRCDDILLVKDTTPATRRKVLAFHHVPTHLWDNALVFHWITQSRDELHLGLQSHTFGNFVLHENSKLDDILHELRVWADRETEHVRLEAVEKGLFNKVEIAQREAASDPSLHPEEVRLVQEHGEYLKNTMLQKSVDEEQRKWQDELLRFVFKFVLLLSAEGIKPKLLAPPGVKDKANPSRKAKKIQDSLWRRWGRRYLVTVPSSPAEEGDDRKSPTRHLVMGHFKSQPYGPASSLRKIIWRQPFWRGTTTLA